MSSVFDKPKVKMIQPKEAELTIAGVTDDPMILLEKERKRQRRMGALSQFLSRDYGYGHKTTLGE